MQFKVQTLKILHLQHFQCIYIDLIIILCILCILKHNALIICHVSVIKSLWGRVSGVNWLTKLAIMTLPLQTPLVSSRKHETPQTVETYSAPN